MHISAVAKGEKKRENKNNFATNSVSVSNSEHSRTEVNSVMENSQ